MANFNEEAAGAYDWTSGGVYVIEKSDPVEGGPDGISNRQGRELALRTRNLHGRLEDLKQEATESAADLAEAIDTKTEAALRSSKEYTDTREAAILAAADGKDAATLRTAKDYADAIVAALIDGSPELMNTLKELAAALGNDPNFAATVMDLIGQKLDAANYTAADVLAKLLTVHGKGSGIISDMIADHFSGGGKRMYYLSESQYATLTDAERNDTGNVFHIIKD